jgi:hypothetical protein
MPLGRRYTIMQIIKKIKSKGTIVKIDPSINEFCIICGEKFYYNFNTQKFELDETPYSDSTCIPVLNLRNTIVGFEFDAFYKKKDTHFSIDCKYPSDKIIKEYLFILNEKGFVFDSQNGTKIEILFENDKLVSIELVKMENFISKDFLTLVFKNEKSLIKYPFQKLLLKSFNLTNNYIICECETEVVKWEVSLPEVAIEIFNRLITYN